jgi:hypothetical protein
MAAAKWADQSWEYINCSQIHVNECGNWETEHYSSVLESAVSFLRIHNCNQTFILDSSHPFICSAVSDQYTAVFQREINKRQKV